MCNLLYFIQDLLIALFRNNSFLGIALSALTFKQFSKYTEDSAPRPSRSPLQRKRNGIAVIDLGKHIGIGRIYDMSAQHAGNALQASMAPSPVPQPVTT